MMQICPTAQTLWNECVRSVNFGTLEEYAAAWSAYQTHKRNCQECTQYKTEYLLRFDAHFLKQKNEAISKGMMKC